MLTPDGRVAVETTNFGTIDAEGCLLEMVDSSTGSPSNDLCRLPDAFPPFDQSVNTIRTPSDATRATCQHHPDAV
jgi:hypothetical protein